jgi:hypothetical protein
MGTWISPRHCRSLHRIGKANFGPGVQQCGRQRTPDWIDYFAFSRGVYDEDLPPLAIGRLFWDKWLVWKVISQKIPVIDASPSVRVVHQNHDYAHRPPATKGIWFGEEQEQNFKLIGGHSHLRTIAHAPHPAGSFRFFAKPHATPELLGTTRKTFSH